MYKEEDLEKLRTANDLVEIAAETLQLRQRGSEFWACCPFHHEKTPSFKINPSLQMFHCFGCGASGDVFKYIMLRENLEFPDAVRYLADRAHIELEEQESAKSGGVKRTRLFDLCENSARFYQKQLLRLRSQKAQETRDYAGKRGLNLDIAKKWGLGFAPGHQSLVRYLHSLGYSDQEMIAANVAVQTARGLQDRFYDRLIFPISNEQGRVIAFGGRIIGEGEPKYLNSQETQIFFKHKNLYALDKAKESIVSSSYAIVCEGYTDVIAMHEAGFNQSVASLGTALTEQHIKLLARFAKKIVFIFDGDRAGQNAAERSLQFIELSKADLFCVSLPDNLDPADYLERYDKQKLQVLIDQAKPLVRFVIDKRLAAYDISVPEQKMRALEDGLDALSYIKGSFLADEYALYLADVLSADPQLVKKQLARMPKKSFQHKQTIKQSIKSTNKEYNNTVTHNLSGAQEQAQSDYASLAQTSSKRNVKHTVFESSELARALRHERELLSLFAQHPQELRAYSQDLLSLPWFDLDHQCIAEAMHEALQLEQLPNMVHYALKASERAAEILSQASLASTKDLSLENSVQFLILELRLIHAQSLARKKSSELKHPELMTSEAYNELFEEVVELQKETAVLSKQIRELTKRD